MKDDLSRYLRDAEKEEIVITRHGKPAGDARQRVKRFRGFERVAQRKLRQLDIAAELRDLAAPPGNRLEALEDDREGSTAFALTISGVSVLCDVMPPVAAMGGRRASALSGGQQEMVTLARAIMTGTKLLPLDEPFEGLAPAMGEGLADTILQLMKDGVTVLIAESDLNRITFVEEVYTIERGEIVLRSASTATARRQV